MLWVKGVIHDKHYPKLEHYETPVSASDLRIISFGNNYDSVTLFMASTGHSDAAIYMLLLLGPISCLQYYLYVPALNDLGSSMNFGFHPVHSLHECFSTWI